MQYKGLIAKYYYDVRSGVFIGEVINTLEVIVFSASTLDKLEMAMRDAIDDYLALSEIQIVN
ncbi:hypothetical protein [Candidatus Berkiella aquae]|uniref:HicB family protein n=1 Tax=Candidatus Berkiella aquae TaxID=295108 RepID=A0A0Q9YCM6_9GAMM|nr:hypothetical protein [Candidatus Berkiella aquae]MCS5710140.1 hypothetical protein [Candidatus Berkiella aquae]